ncbi:MAG: serine protease, partial [Alphaproteobacteria bacterium]|nr:serine protease [Alphaproteobacteria bacterium]
MNRATYLIALLAVLYGVVSALFGNDGGERRPPIQPDFARQAPAPAPAGPTIEVDVGEKTSSSGTAFAIDGDGWWLTARHVADGCDAVWIQTGPRQGLRAMEVRLHPAADLALLRTRVGRTPLSLARQLPPPGDDGFSLGYPRGEPGDIHVRLMGRARLKSVGRYRINEPAVAWAEVA